MSPVTSKDKINSNAGFSFGNLPVPLAMLAKRGLVGWSLRKDPGTHYVNITLH